MDWKLTLLCLLAMICCSVAPRIKNVDFEACDTVMTSMILNLFYPYLPMKPPFHKMFALSRNEVLNVDPINMDLTNLNWKANVEIITLHNYFEFPTNYQYAQTIKPDQRKGPIGEQGIIIARRLEGLTIPYHPLYCNCYHYADYFTYGQTFGMPLGTEWTIYFPVSDDCPLHRKIDPDTDVTAPNFMLLDKMGNKFKLKAFKVKQN